MHAAIILDAGAGARRSRLRAQRERPFNRQCEPAAAPRLETDRGALLFEPAPQQEKPAFEVVLPFREVQGLVQSQLAVGELLAATRWQIPGRPDDTVLVAPGAPAASAMLARMRSRSPSSQMPPLGTVVRDHAAVDAIARWIRGAAVALANGSGKASSTSRRDPLGGSVIDPDN